MVLVTKLRGMNSQSSFICSIKVLTFLDTSLWVLLSALVNTILNGMPQVPSLSRNSKSIFWGLWRLSMRTNTVTRLVRFCR